VASKLARNIHLSGSGPVRYRAIGPQDSPSAFQIAIDYTDAPVPQHYYVADYVSVANLNTDVLFIFGKGERADAPQEKLRSKLEVFFPAPIFVGQLWKSSRTFHQTLRALVEKQGYQVSQVGSPDVSAEKVQTLHANNALLVLTPGETMIDFFYISPRDLYLKTRKGQNIGMEAVVRIILSLPALLSLLNACESIANTLKGKFPEEEKENEILESF
jgi:hypothetical protein